MSNGEEWVTMTEAANRLGTNPSTVTRIVKATKGIDTRRDTLDKRVRLVNYKQLEDVFRSSYKYHQ